MYDSLDEAKKEALQMSLDNPGIKVFVSGNSYGNWYMVDKNAGFEHEDIGYYLVSFFLNGEEEDIEW